MKSYTIKLLIQTISVILFSIIVFYLLLPKGGGSNEGRMAVRFFIRYLLICVICLLISDVMIFKMRRPKFIATILALFAGFGGGFVGSMLVLLFTILIDSLVGIRLLGSEVVGIVFGTVICMVLSYNIFYKLVKW